MRQLQVKARSMVTIELLKYSTFALPDYESDDQSRPVVPYARLSATCTASTLLNYDEDLLSRSIAVKAFPGRVAKPSASLTSRHQRCWKSKSKSRLKFWAGQYVDLTLEGRRHHPRVFDGERARRPARTSRFIIKKYAEWRVLRPSSTAA